MPPLSEIIFGILNFPFISNRKSSSFCFSIVIEEIVKSKPRLNLIAGAITFTLYLGATGANAAGTELFVGESVPANTTKFYPFGQSGLKMVSTDFLVGGASANTSLTITGMGEQNVV